MITLSFEVFVLSIFLGTHIFWSLTVYIGIAKLWIALPQMISQVSRFQALIMEIGAMSELCIYALWKFVMLIKIINQTIPEVSKFSFPNCSGGF